MHKVALHVPYTLVEYINTIDIIISLFTQNNTDIAVLQW